MWQNIAETKLILINTGFSFYTSNFHNLQEINLLPTMTFVLTKKINSMKIFQFNNFFVVNNTFYLLYY